MGRYCENQQWILFSLSMIVNMNVNVRERLLCSWMSK